MSKLKWFNEARYGMFIHFGPYSGAGRGEWIMNRELIPREEYQTLYAERFLAERYDPAYWARKAKDWGMGYMILTSRHHDGFALWDSSVNSFNSVKMGPKRDLLALYVDAVRQAGLKVGVYYSPANWSHPDYPGAFFRDWPGEDDWRDEASRRRFIDYYRAELKELLTRYGKIDYLWFDGCIPWNLDGAETIEMLKGWQPGIVINDRLGKPYDIKVCEQTINPPAQDCDWEACLTLNDNWGFHAGDECWKTPGEVIRMLLACAEKGGNLVLNIGPEADGSIPECSIAILDEAGKWLALHREAVTESERHPFSWNCTARPITMRGNRVYLHCLHDFSGEFCWAELKNKALKAYLLHDGSEVTFRQEGERIFFDRPAHAKVPFSIVLESDGPPEALRAQTTFWIPE